MTAGYGNDAWRKLSSTHTRSGAPVPDGPEDDYADLWPLLTVEQQQAVARGDVEITDLLDIMTASRTAELCPRCCKRPATVERLGLCAVCARSELNLALGAKLAEVVVQREANALKQQTHRERIAAGLPLPRGRDYGRAHVDPTDHPPMTYCDVCTQAFISHGGAITCPECTERREEREARRMKATPSLLSILDARALAEGGHSAPLPSDAELDALAPGDLAAFILVCPIEETGEVPRWTVRGVVTERAENIVFVSPLADLEEIAVTTADVFAVETNAVIAVQLKGEQ